MKIPVVGRISKEEKIKRLERLKRTISRTEKFNWSNWVRQIYADKFGNKVALGASVGSAVDILKEVKNKKTSCNTTLCVAGWAVVLFGDEKILDAIGNKYFYCASELLIPKYAKKLLGLSTKEVDYLFYPWGDGYPYDDEKKVAIRRINDVIKSTKMALAG